LDYKDEMKATETAAAARRGPLDAVNGESSIVNVACRKCRALLWQQAASSLTTSSSPSPGRVVEMPLLAPEWRAAGSFFCHHAPGTGGGGGDEVQPRPGEFVMFPFKLRTNCDRELRTETDGGDGMLCPKCEALVGVGHDLFLDSVCVELEDSDSAGGSDAKNAAFDRFVWAVAKALPGRVQPLTVVIVPVDKRKDEGADDPDVNRELGSRSFVPPHVIFHLFAIDYY
jgi:hypothetical protein